MQEMSMSDGNVNIIHSWIPDGDVKAVVLLSHGMTEHASRYARFGELLTKDGFALYAEDHRGHGETAKLAEEKGTGQFGYLADKNGFFRVVDDIHEEALFLRNKYEGKKLFLFGHSFGSFISQCFIEKYGDCIDGVILCGTAGPQKGLIAFASAFGNLIKFFTGKHHYSKLVDNLSFGSYNNHIKNPRTKFDWLTRDNAIVDAYVADPWCGYTCTIGFYCDMFSGLKYIHTEKNMLQIPRTLPVFFIDGDEDPVGGYSKTVQDLCTRYQGNGIKDVSIKFYSGARHELLNETNKEEVEQDVLSWFNSHV